MICLWTDSPRDSVQYIEWSPRSCPRALLIANFHGRITIWTQPSHVSIWLGNFNLHLVLVTVCRRLRPTAYVLFLCFKIYVLFQFRKWICYLCSCHNKLLSMYILFEVIIPHSFIVILFHIVLWGIVTALSLMYAFLV